MSALQLTVNNNFIWNKKLNNDENQSKQLKLSIFDSQAASEYNKGYRAWLEQQSWKNCWGTTVSFPVQLITDTVSHTAALRISKIDMICLLQDINFFIKSVSHVLKIARTEPTHHP